MPDRLRVTHVLYSYYNEMHLADSPRYLRQRFPSVPAWQVSEVGRKDLETADGIRVAPGVALLRQLV